MGIIVNRQAGQNYSDNIIDPLLAFNDNQTWSVSSGTGSASLDTNVVFEGLSSLKILNTAPTTDLVITNSTQKMLIPYDSDYGFSFYMRKDEVDEFMTLELNVYQTAVLFDTQTFVLGSETTADDINDKWVRFVIDTDYSLTKGDDITFTLTLKGKVGTALPNTTVWLDGFMFYDKQRLNSMPPYYVRPIKSVIKYKTTSQTGAYTALIGDVVLADGTSGAFTVTLPTAAGNKDGIITVKKIDNINNITIDGNGSETIDGATTVVLSTQYDSVTMISNGSNWFVI